VAGIVKVPVIGCGGISCAEDALEFIMAGASAVQVGTANLANPRATIEVLDGIVQIMEPRGICRLKDIVGIARS
jgi:dihydroorotate dehydrogenase (NAD+) catalytic subunit